jgi:hypothetical protein
MAKAAKGSLGVTVAARVPPTGGGTAGDDKAENMAEPGIELPQPAINSVQASSAAGRIVWNLNQASGVNRRDRAG